MKGVKQYYTSLFKILEFCGLGEDIHCPVGVKMIVRHLQLIFELAGHFKNIQRKHLHSTQ